MAQLGGHLDLDQNQNQDQDSLCRGTGDPQLDRAVRQWLTWDQVNTTPNLTTRRNDPSGFGSNRTVLVFGSDPVRLRESSLLGSTFPDVSVYD